MPPVITADINELCRGVFTSIYRYLDNTLFGYLTRLFVSKGMVVYVFRPTSVPVFVGKAN